jgi:hypothetical protein
MSGEYPLRRLHYDTHAPPSPVAGPPSGPGRRTPATDRLGAFRRGLSDVAEVSASVELTVDGPTGYPVFDLRQQIEEAIAGRQAAPA